MSPKNSAASAVISVPFHSVRNISSPEDLQEGRKTLSGQLPASATLDLPTNENVRDYLLDAKGRKRYPTAVHKAIEDTLKNRPQDFSVLNGGIVIVARDYEIDEKKKTLRFLQPSIINGSQTQGVIRDFLENTDAEVPSIHVKFEAIITEDPGLVAEISIARNFQNDVMKLSIAGRRGQLDELESAVQAKLPDLKIRKSETDLSEEYLETEHLLQVSTLLIPEELWFKAGEEGSPNKVYAYSRKSQCLKEFGELHDAVNHKKAAPWLQKVDRLQVQELYQFYLDIAPQAYELHRKWRQHQGFIGTGIRAIEREGGKVVRVPDGIIFPILASLSAFARKTSDGWVIEQPPELSDRELIQAADETYKEVAKSNPPNMGRNKACYSPLYRITSIYRRLNNAS